MLKGPQHQILRITEGLLAPATGALAFDDLLPGFSPAALVSLAHHVPLW